MDEIRVNVKNGSAVQRSMCGAIQRRIRENWKNIRKVLCKIGRLISYYEMKEATTIFELALWKSKLRQAGSNKANHGDYCVAVPGPAQNAILEYLLGKRKSRSVNGVEEWVPWFDV